MRPCAARALSLIEFGKDFQDSREHAAKLAKADGLHFVPPFHRDIVTGVATYWMELFTASPRPRRSLCSNRYGIGYLCGLRRAQRHEVLKPKSLVLLSEAPRPMRCRLKLDASIAAPVTTLIADGMACRVPDDDAVEIIRRTSITWSRSAMMKFATPCGSIFQSTHNMIEGAGAAHWPLL